MEGNWGIKGLYAYTKGRWAGTAWFSTGGTEEQKTAPIDKQKYLQAYNAR